MSVRRTALFIAVATIGLSAAHAAGTNDWVGGEIGFVDRPVQSTLAREQIRKEFEAFRNSPVAPDGAEFVGGEVGYMFPQHTYARQKGSWVRTDSIPHNPKPSLNKTDAERRLFLEQYFPA